MLNQLLEMAQNHLDGISRDIPELTDVDSKQITSITSKTVVDTILQQAKKGNMGSLREMLSGADTDNQSDVLQQLKGPVVNQLQSKLNISGQSAQQLAVMALPIIMNMLNGKVNAAKTNGFDINNALQGLSQNKGGFLNSILGMFGGNNQNSKMINNIITQQYACTLLHPYYYATYQITLFFIFAEHRTHCVGAFFMRDIFLKLQQPH